VPSRHQTERFGAQRYLLMLRLANINTAVGF